MRSLQTSFFLPQNPNQTTPMPSFLICLVWHQSHSPMSDIAVISTIGECLGANGPGLGAWLGVWASFGWGQTVFLYQC